MTMTADVQKQQQAPMVPKKNGTPKQDGADYGVKFAEAFRKVEVERDEALAKIKQLTSDVERSVSMLNEASRKETMASDEMASLRRQIETLKLECVHAIAERGAVEATLESMMAIGRAFQTKNVPLLRQREDEDFSTSEE